jgi:bifunctional DNase/RNase
MIEVSVDRIQVNLVSQSRVVILRETAGNRFLPIWIGQFEAEAIAMFLQEVEAVRPMTHDLLKNVLAGLGATLERLEIHDLQDDVFYARLILRSGNEAIEVDSRPSDGIALAVRAHAPIFVAEEVMNRAGAVPEADIREKGGEPSAPEEGSADKRLDVFKDFIQRLDRDEKPPDSKPKS